MDYSLFCLMLNSLALPQTGEDLRRGIFIGLGVILLAVVLGLIILLRRRRQDDTEEK